MITTSVKPLSFNYQQGFKYDDVKLQGDVSLLYSYIQLTSTSRYQTNTYSVGRVSYVFRAITTMGQDLKKTH
jgi:hypothetical protein